jgi:hypothetical protein
MKKLFVKGTKREEIIAKIKPNARRYFLVNLLKNVPLFRSEAIAAGIEERKVNTPRELLERPILLA